MAYNRPSRMQNCDPFGGAYFKANDGLYYNYHITPGGAYISYSLNYGESLLSHVRLSSGYNANGVGSYAYQGGTGQVCFIGSSLLRITPCVNFSDFSFLLGLGVLNQVNQEFPAFVFGIKTKFTYSSSSAANFIISAA